MGELGIRRWLPWHLLLTLSALAGILFLIFPGASATVLGTAWLAATAVFFLMRWQQNSIWGIIAALAVPLHPLWHHERTPTPLLAETLELIVLNCVLAGWRLTFLPRFAWLFWSLTAIGLTLGNALAWATHPRTGLITGFLTISGLLLATVLALRVHRRSLSHRPSWGNLIVAVPVSLVAVTAGFLLVPVVVEVFAGISNSVLQGGDPGTLLRAATDFYFVEFPPPGFSTAESERWGWPSVWLTVPLVLFGLWRSISRGVKELARNKAPLAWGLTLYALLGVLGTLLHPAESKDVVLLRLASLAVLLSVFGVADFVRGITDRLVLAPPEERDQPC
jgi:hypothetical protein